MPPVYYAGGTVSRDVESTDLTAAVRDAGRDARDLAVREDLPAAVADEARDGDVVMVMGARDPALTGLATLVLQAISDELS